MTHKRSTKKREERATKREIKWTLKTKIIQESFRDPIYAETIARTSHTQLESYALSLFGEEYYRLEEQQGEPFYAYLEVGTVLADTRARGAFQ